MSPWRAFRPPRHWRLAAALALGVALSACSEQAPPPAEAPHAAAPHHDHAAMQQAAGTVGGSQAPGPASQFQREMDVGMAQMMADMHAPGYSGDPDMDFLAMMVPHHQGAVDMARLVLLHGRDPVTRAMAEEIIAGQVVEIESMQRRLAALRAPNAVPAEAEFPVLGGTRGP